MDDLPAIIHRLSLRMWCPEHRAKEEQEERMEKSEKEEVPIDPFGSPPQDAVDARGNVLDASEIASLSLDGGSEIHSLFSQKNLIRLATLNDSHRTLSLFTPSIRDAVFRAWAGPSERSDSAGTSTPSTPGLMRTNSTLGSSSTTYTFSRGSDDGNGHTPRPSLVSLQSATTGLGLGAGRHSRTQRKKKTRVVNLRKPKTTDDIVSESGDSETASIIAASEPAMSTFVSDEPEDNIITPPHSPAHKVRFQSIDLEEPLRRSRTSTLPRPTINLNSRPMPEEAIVETAPIHDRNRRPSFPRSSFAPYPVDKKAATPSTPVSYNPAPVQTSDTPASRGIVEQAWVLKMAGEIARYANDEKAANGGFWSSSSNANEREDSPPPAYQPKA